MGEIVKLNFETNNSITAPQHSLTLLGLLDKVESSIDSNTKGKALEQLMHQLFSTVDDFDIFDNIRTETEEIDLWIEHSGITRHFQNEESIILAECKNWTGKVGKNDFVILLEKMRTRGGRCSLAFLISWNGFAETIKKEMLRSSRDRQLIVPLDGSKIKNSIKNNSFLELLINEKRKTIAL